MSVAQLYIIRMSVVAVVRLTHREGDFLDKVAYKRLLLTGLELFGGDPGGLMKSLFPRGAVALKTNCLTGFNSTAVPFVDAVTELLVLLAGHDENDVIVWERSNRELKNAGYQLNVSSFGGRCLGTDTEGVGYGSQFYQFGRVSSLVTRVLTDLAAHSVNLPVLKDHSIAGLSGGLKNMFGAINNPNKYHADNCNPFAAEINCLAPIRDKHRLTIIDAVRIQYDNGPGFDENSLDYYNGLIISGDPVAADRVALEILEYLRMMHQRPTLAASGRPVKYLDSAQEVGLGTAALEKIDLRVVSINQYGMKQEMGRSLF